MFPMSPITTRTKLARLCVVLLISAIGLAACGATSGAVPPAAPALAPISQPADGRSAPSQPGSAGESGYYASSNADASTVADKQGQEAGDDANKAITDRIVLKNATLSLIVDDPAGALKTIG